MSKDIIANSEYTEVATVLSVDKMPSSALDAGDGQGDKPYIKEGHGQGEARQAQEVTQTAFLQIEAVAFEVAEHLFDPHAPLVETERDPLGGQVRGQKPRGRIARSPDGQEVGVMLMFLSQLHTLKPLILSRASDQRVDPAPSALLAASYLMATFLAQNIAPAPVRKQILERCELAITCHHNVSRLGHQLVYVAQQRFLLATRTMPLLVSDPGPSQRQCPSTISDGHHQQLMAIGHFCRVDYQLYRLPSRHSFYQQSLSNWLIPLPYSDVAIVQKAGNSAGATPTLSPAKQMAGNVTQMYGTAVIDAGHEPRKIPESGYMFHWKHLSNLSMKGMICLDDGHLCLLFWLVLLPFTLTGFVAIVSLFLKMSGN